MSSYSKRRFLAIFIALLMVMPFLPIITLNASQALRDRVRELEIQQQDAARRVRDAENLLEGTIHEMSELVAEMQELDQRQMDAFLDLENATLALYQTELRITEAEDDLSLAQDERDIQYNLFRARIRAMHEHGPVSWLEALFQAGNISEFFMRLELIRAVAQYDQELLERLDYNENRIQANVDVLSNSRNLLRSLQNTQQEATRELERVIEERTAFFYALAEDAEQMEELLAILREEEYMWGGEVTAVRSQLQAQLAAEERARREEQRRVAEAERQAQLAHLNNFGGSFQWPVPDRSAVPQGGGFGTRTNPVTRRQEFHTGIDIPAPMGSRIVAAQDGVVRFAGWSAGFGNYIIIDHYGGYSTLYGHNSVNRVSQGQRVTRNQHIADVGSTGISTGPHLHFEIRMNNQHRDPLAYFGR